MQEALRLRAKKIRALSELAGSMECLVTYLRDNRASEADDHSPADDFRLDDEVPRLVEQLAEAGQVERRMLLRADADDLRRARVGQFGRRRQNVGQFLLKGGDIHGGFWASIAGVSGSSKM